MERRSAAAGLLPKHLSSAGEQAFCNGAGPCAKRARAAEAASAERGAEGAPRPGRAADGSPAGSQALRCERVARSRLSFGDELDNGQDGPGIAASTAKRCACTLPAPRTAVQCSRHSASVCEATSDSSRCWYSFLAEQKAARATHAQPQASPSSLLVPEGAPAPQQPSLGRLCFGVAQARGAHVPRKQPAVASSLPLAEQGCAGGAGARAYMEDKHTVVSSFKPLGAAGAVEDGVERSYFAVFDGAGCSWLYAVLRCCP